MYRLSSKHDNDTLFKLIASKLMINGLHCMIHLLVIEWCTFIVFVFDIIFYSNRFNTFCGLVVFILASDI